MSGSLDNYWMHDWPPFLWEFSPGIGIRYYGLAYVLGFLIAAWLLGRYTSAGRSPLTKDQNSDLLFALVLGVLVGGRLGYFLLYAPGELFHPPLALLRVWDGGMASHGGFAGVLIALLWFARRTKTNARRLADLVATITPPGLLLGRIANFINGELWGRITDVPWAVRFPLSVPPGTLPERVFPRHPSQLYEAATEGLLLLVYLQLRFWCSRTAQDRPGQIAGECLIVYALARIVCEQYREPDAALIGGLSRGAFYSIFLLLAGVASVLFARLRPLASPS